MRGSNRQSSQRVGPPPSRPPRLASRYAWRTGFAEPELFRPLGIWTRRPSSTTRPDPTERHRADALGARKTDEQAFGRRDRRCENGHAAWQTADVAWDGKHEPNGGPVVAWLFRESF